jgi:hypothetical protein
MPCPTCGGSARTQIASGYWLCETMVVSEMAVPHPTMPGRMVPVRHSRPCTTEYHEAVNATVAESVSCSCGTFAIGRCPNCQSPICGSHSGLWDRRRLCDACYAKENAKQIKQRKEQEARAERERQRKEQEARPERERQERERQAHDRERRQREESERVRREAIDGLRFDIGEDAGYSLYLVAYLAVTSALVLWYSSKSVTSSIEYRPGGLGPIGFLVLAAGSMGLMSWGLYLALRQGSSSTLRGIQRGGLMAYLGGGVACIAAGYLGRFAFLSWEAYVSANQHSAHALLGFLLLPLMPLSFVAFACSLYCAWKILSLLVREMV